LWKSADKAELAAEALGITAERLHRLKLVDEVIPEPLGGAHRDAQTMADTLKHAVAQTMATLQAIPLDTLLVQRRKRLASYGVFKEG
jgi:acetyl-CoA carboxylase carboxyl transferase subunit alpha